MPQRKRFEYEIDGTKYVQEPLVLGQLIQLAETLAAVEDLPLKSKDPVEWAKALGGSVPEAMAVILCPEGVALFDRDLAAMAKLFRWKADVPTALRVVRDFFACSPAEECRPHIEELVELIESLLAQASGASLPSSPGETPSGAGPSSGASPRKK
jgi:hypothetical protein